MISTLRIVSLAGAIGMLSSLATPASAQSAAQATVIDQRVPESLEGHRDSNFSAIAFLPEKSVKPAPVDQLRDALYKRATHPISLEISELRVIDYFPRRIKAGPGGWLNNAIMKSLVNSKTDWSFVDGIGISNDEDSVICLLSGTVNGREFKVATHAPYKLGGFSVMVRSDKNFKAAVSSSIDQAAQKVIDQASGAQASQ